MQTVVIALAMLVLLAPALAGAQTTAPPPPAPGSPSTAPPAPATPPAQPPASPGTPAPRAPDVTAPRAPDATAPRAPDSPAVPGDRAGDGRILGLSPIVAVIFGLIILGVIIALVASRRRDTDVVVDTRLDAGLPPERPFGTTESEIERERRRRAS